MVRITKKERDHKAEYQKRKEYQRKWYKKNKAWKKAYNQRPEEMEKGRIRSRKYYYANKEEINKKRRKYREENLIKVRKRERECMKKYLENNREKHNKRANEYYHKDKTKHLVRSQTRKILYIYKKYDYVKLKKICLECGSRYKLWLFYDISPFTTENIIKAIKKGKIRYLCSRHWKEAAKKRRLKWERQQKRKI